MNESQLRDAIKAVTGQISRAARLGALVAAGEFMDPAFRRAIILGGAALLIRRLPFLEQDVAEQLSTEILVSLGVLFSKLPGSDELQRRAQVAKEAAALAIRPGTAREAPHCEAHPEPPPFPPGASGPVSEAQGEAPKT